MRFYNSDIEESDRLNIVKAIDSIVTLSKDKLAFNNISAYQHLYILKKYKEYTEFHNGVMVLKQFNSYWSRTDLIFCAGFENRDDYIDNKILFNITKRGISNPKEIRTLVFCGKGIANFDFEYNESIDTIMYSYQDILSTIKELLF